MSLFTEFNPILVHFAILNQNISADSAFHVFWTMIFREFYSLFFFLKAFYNSSFMFRGCESTEKALLELAHENIISFAISYSISITFTDNLHKYLYHLSMNSHSLSCSCRRCPTKNYKVSNTLGNPSLITNLPVQEEVVNSCCN